MIRIATPEDAPAIATIWNHIIRETTHTFTTTEKSADDLARQIATGTPMFVSTDAGRVLGFATYGQFRNGNGYARTMEHSIHLAPEAQGRGLGRALMQMLEDHARQAGAHQMIAGCAGENLGGQAFHAALGYARIAVIPQAGFKWGCYHDLVLMQKFLS